VSYLPTREADLKTFAENFAALIVAAPANYALVANDATAIDQATQDFVTKWNLVQNPGTRTAPSLAAKDAAKTTLTAILRGYAMLIKSNRAVSDQAKIALRIGVYDFVRTAVAAPTTRPQVSVVGVDIKQHELHFADSTTAEKKAKPAGAQGLQLFYLVAPAGTPAPEDPLSARFYAVLTKPSLTMRFTAADSGKTAWYMARWQTATGLVGPWSVPVSMPVAG
jgi:hypothetical protein